MISKPAYFDAVQKNAVKRWDQLENEPELAGPWRQLFRQVQSPRHILSELLQNADDAGATESSVRIESGTFVFEHDGEDFTEEHFSSLCRFGYSNKRALHTIGFRGIGFKSTFSIGDRVELLTPTLAVYFERHRFTEPRLLEVGPRGDGKTCVRVEISDDHRRSEVEKNLNEWLESPVSLLFFKNIRHIEINGSFIHWNVLRPGPVADSEWIALNDNAKPVLLIRSEAALFPKEALEEIRHERTLENQEEFPPCKIEIVLGLEGRLFVVLPTGVETALPFAINAPFIAKPDRDDIKDPAISPTNRWLLQRAGKLAASAMLCWLNAEKMPPNEQARAYGLVPDVNRGDNSLEGDCGAIVEKSFEEAISDAAVLLTEDGKLVGGGASIIVPEAILDVWSPTQVTKLIDEKARSPLSRHVSEDDRDKLLNWGIIEELDNQAFIGVLRERHLPKPKTWARLLTLWAYVAPEATGFWNRDTAISLRIVPVQGKDVLYAATEVVRLGEKRLLQSETDWQFLAKYLLVLNQNWLKFLAVRRRTAEGKGESGLVDLVDSSYAVLEAIRLGDTSDAGKAIDRVAAELFSRERVPLKESIQLAQIAAKLGARADASFRFVASDATLSSLDKPMLFDADGTLEELLPEAVCGKWLLHSDYVAAFSSCTEEEWRRWVRSGQAGLSTFAPLTQGRKTVYGRGEIEREVRKRGGQGEINCPYKTDRFVLEDWDFDEPLWRHWAALAKADDRAWCRVAERILMERETFWNRARSAKALQVATTGNTRTISYGSLLPNWVLRLRILPCLPDTQGIPRRPEDLLRLTPETESMLDVEPFLNRLIDRETAHPILDLLGVRTSPLGPEALLERLRALAKADVPPVSEIDKYYRRLDQLAGTCSTPDLNKVIQTFRIENLILSQDGTWTDAQSVFLAPDEDGVPGAAIIRAPVANLALWRKIGVRERPTVELALQWLKSLPSGRPLSPGDVHRVRELLKRYPVQIWEECEHWINLAAEWVPVVKLRYGLTMQPRIAWRHLEHWVKQQTADLQWLSAEFSRNEPFAALGSLAGQLEERFYRDPLFAGHPEPRDWLEAVGAELCRLRLDSESESSRIRGISRRLFNTRWQVTPDLEVIPYLDGVPAGKPRRAEVVWLDEVLHVDDLTKAKLAKRVPQEIEKHFEWDEIKAVLDYSFERSPADIRAYLAENYDLDPAAQIEKSNESDESQSPEQKSAGDSESYEVGNDDGTSIYDQMGVVDDSIQNADRIGPSEEKSGQEIPKLGGLLSTGDRTSSAPRPKRPTIVERFARAKGYRKDSEDRFYSDRDGSWLGRTDGLHFPWELCNASGEVERYYWPKDHCLEREPLQLEAEVWALVDQNSDKYALILEDGHGAAVEVTGTRLRAMVDSGVLTLFPATYRIVYSSDTHT
ncbi:MAG: hypothetical protein RH942_01325 [Kiloniellaceae bacterium]